MSDSDQKRFLPNSETCFVCGEANGAGLQTRFFVENGIVKTILRPQSHHCGYANVVHGGVLTAILDECMGWAAARAIGRMCYTGDLSIRFLRPVPADRETMVRAEVRRAGRRLVEAVGTIVDNAGLELAQAEGRFLPLSVEETITVDDALLYRGGEERVFDHLRRSTPICNRDSCS
ncbi:MAG: PaaI family thioesterase [Candidatus Hydrogenedentes bacterium]|nr:PaaI family thioesterase [Candidatus Hydrogenedentota bacterium]